MARKNKRPGQLPSVSPPAATAQSSQTAQPTNEQPKPKPKPKAHRTGWLYKDVDRRTCLRTITPTRLAPCGQPVTSDGEVAVLGTFCWTPEKTVRVPSREPVFQHVALPAVLPPAPSLRAAARIGPKASKRHGKNGAGANKASNNNNNNNNNTMPPHAFAPLSQAITTMSPSHRLRGTDLVVQRNSLRKLFALCAGRSPESFRVGLHLFGDTLVITKYDRFAWHPGITRASGVGLSFEQKFTRDLPGMEGDQAHHRVISYSLGDLRCVVQFEVDACYHDEKETATGELAVEEQLRLLSLEPADAVVGAPPKPKADANPASKPKSCPAPVLDCAGAAPQSTVAEMKTSNKEVRLAETLPQLWFGRTSWLIQGRRAGDSITAVQITRAAERFAAWEERHQETLRRVVTLVRELRDSVRAAGPGGHYCVLVYDRAAQGEPGAQQRVVRVYRSSCAKDPIPKDMVQRLWGPD